MSPDKQDDIISIAHAVACIFTDLGINYFIGGSVASSIQGEFRATNDVDILAEIQPIHLKHFYTLLGDTYYFSETALREGVHIQSSFNLIHFSSALKIDIFVSKSSPFECEQMRRRQLLHVRQEIDLYICSPEDILLNKLLWFKKSDLASERQWRDVLGIIRVQQNRLDLEYVKKWATQIGVVGLCDKAFVENEILNP